MTKGTLDIDQFRELIRAARVTCLECKWRGHSLVQHLREAHNLSTKQYQNKYPESKYPENYLSSPIVREILKRIDRSPKTTDDLNEFKAMFETNVPPLEMIANCRSKLPAPDPAYQHCATPGKREPNFHFPPGQTLAMLTGLVTGKNVYVSGPTGCGKTELVVQAHLHLDRPFLRVNMKGDATVANFIGAMRASPQKGTYFHYGALPNAMRGGLTLLVDEIDYTPPQIAAVLNPALEHHGSIYLEDTGETIKAHPGFRVIATGNTSGKSDPTGVYTGTEILNTALLDRFGVKITADYLPEDVETKMLINRFPGVDAGLIKLMTKIANEIRTSFKKGQLAVTLSTRKLVDYFELLPTLGQQATLDAVLMDWLDADDATIVATIADRCGFTTNRK